MDGLEKLKRRNGLLERLCRDLAAFAEGFMKAASEDNPQLLELPNFVAGQAKLAEMRMYFEKPQGEA